MRFVWGAVGFHLGRRHFPSSTCTAAARGRPGGKARPRGGVPPHRRTCAQLAPSALRQGARFLCASSPLACESPRYAPGRRLEHVLARVRAFTGQSRLRRSGMSRWSQGRLTHRARFKLVPGAVFVRVRAFPGQSRLRRSGMRGESNNPGLENSSCATSLVLLRGWGIPFGLQCGIWQCSRTFGRLLRRVLGLAGG